MNKKIKNLEKEIKALEKQGLDTSSLKTSIQMLKKDYKSKLTSRQTLKHRSHKCFIY